MQLFKSSLTPRHIPFCNSLFVFKSTEPSQQMPLPIACCSRDPSIYLSHISLDPSISLDTSVCHQKVSLPIACCSRMPSICIKFHHFCVPKNPSASFSCNHEISCNFVGIHEIESPEINPSASQAIESYRLFMAQHNQSSSLPCYQTLPPCTTTSEMSRPYSLL